MSQVTPVVEEVAAEDGVDFYMDELKEEYLDTEEVKEEDLDMEKVDVEEAVEADVVSVAIVVEAVEEEAITIVTTTMEVSITIMELIHWILRGNLHLKKYQLLFKLIYGTIFVLNKGQSEGGSIIMMTVISQQK